MFVIEHSRGLVLFDTGSAPETAEDISAYWGEDVAAGLPYQIERREIIDGQLFDLGYRCDEVHYVVVSHLHIDHAGGLRFFNKAEIVVHKDELADALCPPPGFNDGSYNLSDFLPIRNNKVRKLEDDCDLFGDGSVIVLHTPGHTAGHCSLLVDLPHTGRVILPGDACFCQSALDLATLPGQPIPAPDLALSSLSRISSYINDGAFPLYSHVTRDEYHLINKYYD
jgi:N-acyl homoserine lactone hydrolase